MKGGWIGSVWIAICRGAGGRIEVGAPQVAAEKQIFWEDSGKYHIAPLGLVFGSGLPVVREAARVGALRPAATGSSWSKYRPPSACAVVKSAARTITARIGAARPKAREAGEEKVAAISDPVSKDRRRLFRLFRLSCCAEARARGAVLRRPPKMEYTATMKVDATVVMVARRCARGGVRERTGRGSVEASKEESGCDFTRASGRCSRRGDVYPRRGVDCVECCAYDPSSELLDVKCASAGLREGK